MTNRPSPMQLEGFVDFLEKNPGIAKGLLRTTLGKMETKRKWASLALTLNALGGAVKDGQGWAKYWAEKKHALKKHCTHASARVRRTRGGPTDNLATLSALDSRLVAVMGVQDFATVDPNLTVNPFPELNIPGEPSNIIEPPENAEKTDAPGYSQLDTHDTTPTIAPKPASSTPLASNLPRPRRRRLSFARSVDDMKRFASNEARLVEAEVTSAQAIVKLAEAVTAIADVIRDIARNMPNP